MKTRLLALAGLALGVLLSGCASAPSDLITIPRAPAWRLPTNTQPVNQWDVFSGVSEILPGVPVYFSDGAYSVVSHVWLEEFVTWTWEAQKQLGFTYVRNTRDCDKFAMAAFLAATDKAADAGLEATPLFARLTVDQVADFAGVKGGSGRHMLNGIYTDRAPHFWVLEPQPGAVVRLVPLAQYPNRERILSIVLGDYNPL